MPMAQATKRVSLSGGDLDAMSLSARKAGEFLKAIAHESRLRILCQLAHGEKHVAELEGALEVRQSTVSQQLARLRLEGLVTFRRDGKQVYYSLASDDVKRVIAVLVEIFCKDRAA